MGFFGFLDFDDDDKKPDTKEEERKKRKAERDAEIRQMARDEAKKLLDEELEPLPAKKEETK